jgi:dihydroneopterin triphosphate diphosphatase
VITTQSEKWKRPESVLVIVSAGNQVLLLQKRDVPTFWQSVTGSLLWQEDKPFDAAWRELKEETGLTAHEGKLVDCQYQERFRIYTYWQYRYAPGTTHNLEHVFCFVLKKPLEIKLSEEHLSYCWLEKEAAAKKVSSPSNRRAILKFVGGYHGRP